MRSAGEMVTTPSSEAADGADGATGAADEVLLRGELTVVGRIRSASNATFLCEAVFGDAVEQCVYKPVRGEAPLWDFPDGTLAGREYGAYLVSAALGWNVVPRTVVRDGPVGPGMVQRWVEQPDPDDMPGDALDLVDLVPADRVPPGYLPILQAYDHRGDEVTLVHADDPRLRLMAVFDVLINNADRKGGHILHGLDGRVYGVDHGVSLHCDDKLRTVLWGWAGKPVDDDVLADVRRLRDAVDGDLGAQLEPFVTAEEITALYLRTIALLEDPVMPTPDRHRPIPWPAF